MNPKLQSTCSEGFVMGLISGCLKGHWGDRATLVPRGEKDGWTSMVVRIGEESIIEVFVRAEPHAFLRDVTGRTTTSSNNCPANADP